MRRKNHHFQLVDQWTSEALKEMTPQAVVMTFNEVFSLIWSTAEVTLGSVTLQAVTDRVVSVAHDFYPWITPLTCNRQGYKPAGKLSVLTSMSGEELRMGLGFMLGELLTVLGNLTGDVISAKLHALLVTDGLDDRKRSNLSQKDEDTNRSSAKGGKKS